MKKNIILNGKKRSIENKNLKNSGKKKEEKEWARSKQGMGLRGLSECKKCRERERGYGFSSK